jgi:hypothetical protein
MAAPATVSHQQQFTPPFTLASLPAHTPPTPHPRPTPTRFLDAQRITNLTRYLEQLHVCGLAGADHTTLLLNCYTKLKDVAKLDAFIHRCEGWVWVWV